MYNTVFKKKIFQVISRNFLRGTQILQLHYCDEL